MATVWSGDAPVPFFLRLESRTGHESLISIEQSFQNLLIVFHHGIPGGFFFLFFEGPLFILLLLIGLESIIIIIIIIIDTNIRRNYYFLTFWLARTPDIRMSGTVMITSSALASAGLETNVNIHFFLL